MPVWTFLGSYDFAGKPSCHFVRTKVVAWAISEADIRGLCPTAALKRGRRSVEVPVGTARAEIASAWLKLRGIPVAGD